MRSLLNSRRPAATPGPDGSSRRARRWKAVGLVSAGLVAGSVVGGVAFASIPSSTGVIHGCYSTSSNPPGRLRVIDTSAGQACQTGEIALNWDQSAFHFQGPWSATTAYQIGDVVTSSGSSYLALVANTNVTPKGNPTTWAVLAAKGATGATGSTGATGPQGPTGPPGPAGPANLQLETTRGAISVTIASQACAVLNVGIAAITPGDTGLVVPDAAHWPAGITLTPLRATANGALPVDFCNPTKASVSVSNVQVSTYRIAG